MKMMFARDLYLHQLIAKKDSSLVKVITGIRRVGKSTLLFSLFYNYLLSIGVKEENIIKIQLDKMSDFKYRNPYHLLDYVKTRMVYAHEKYYLFIDEIQYLEKAMVEGVDDLIYIYELLNELNSYDALDIYVTGSNSMMLSSDILSIFRGRIDEIRVYPLTYKEYFTNVEDKKDALKNYLIYGGMPLILEMKSEQEKDDYLHNLLKNVYLKDIIERHRIEENKDVLDSLLAFLSSSTSSLISVTKLANTFKTNLKRNVAPSTINKYLTYFSDAFIVKDAQRYDVKGRKYIGSPLKYYFVDTGLRNASINFRQVEENHLMENVIFNHLRVLGFKVDVGNYNFNYKVEGKNYKKQLEIDFVATKNNTKYYIQSVHTLSDEKKYLEETKAFDLLKDAFKKIIVEKECLLAYFDERGYYHTSLEDFLLDDMWM